MVGRSLSARKHIRSMRFFRCFIFAAVCAGTLSAPAEPSCSTTGTCKPPPDVDLAERCHAKDLEGVKQALLNGADPNVEHYTDNATALHLATYMGSAAIVKVLLDSGRVRDVNKLTRIKEDRRDTVTHGGVVVSGFSCLHIAAQEGRVKITRMLLDAGADPELHSDNFRAGATPLYVAALHGHTGVASKLIMAGATTTTKSTVNGTLPLWAAARVGSRGVVKLLLKAGADVNGQRGYPVRHLLNGKLRELNEVPMASRAAELVNSKATALHVAVQSGHIAVVRLLIAAGADQTLEDRGLTALAVAHKYDRAKIAKLLDQPPPLSAAEELAEEFGRLWYAFRVWFGYVLDGPPDNNTIYVPLYDGLVLKRWLLIAVMAVFELWRWVGERCPGTRCARWHPHNFWWFRPHEVLKWALVGLWERVLNVARPAGERERKRTHAQREARRLKAARNRAQRRLTKAADIAVRVASNWSDFADEEAKWAENFATVCEEEAQEEKETVESRAFLRKMQGWLDHWPQYRRTLHMGDLCEADYIAQQDEVLLTSLKEMKTWGDRFITPADTHDRLEAYLEQMREHAAERKGTVLKWRVKTWEGRYTFDPPSLAQFAATREKLVFAYNFSFMTAEELVYEKIRQLNADEKIARAQNKLAALVLERSVFAVMNGGTIAGQTAVQRKIDATSAENQQRRDDMRARWSVADAQRDQFVSLKRRHGEYKFLASKDGWAVAEAERESFRKHTRARFARRLELDKARLRTLEQVSSFMYRYILRESCSQFDSLPLTSLAAHMTFVRWSSRFVGPRPRARARLDNAAREWTTRWRWPRRRLRRLRSRLPRRLRRRRRRLRHRLRRPLVWAASRRSSTTSKISSASCWGRARAALRNGRALEATALLRRAARRRFRVLRALISIPPRRRWCVTRPCSRSHRMSSCAQSRRKSWRTL